MIRLLSALTLLGLLAACSSSFGGGSSEPDRAYIVVPPGHRLVCEDGSPPPCR